MPKSENPKVNIITLEELKIEWNRIKTLQETCDRSAKELLMHEKQRQEMANFAYMYVDTLIQIAERYIND